MEIFQHYQVLKRPDGSPWELGRGAMGVTYKAFDTNLRCNVALKVINAAYLDSEMAQQRFLREARAAAGLSHPNVASVFHLGESGGNYFYAMEFIDGETLEAFVRREGPLSPLLALQITLQVARALRAASRVGLVHRDIKPANLMLLRHDEEDEIHVKVIDFGLAKLSHVDGEGSATITVAGFVGTPHFASPEQLEEKDLDVRSDMYSLGVSLWYMLAGRPPFAGSVVQIMSQQLTRQPPFEQLAGLPPEVLKLLEHLLEKDAAKRPQSAADLRREIEQVMQSLGTPGAIAAKADASQASTEEPDPTSFPTEAAPEEGPVANQAAAPAKPTGPLGPASGAVLAYRYRLLHEVARGQSGDLFQAIELDSGRAVAIKILPPGSLATTEQFRQAQEEVNKARASPHPALLEVYALEHGGGGRTFLSFQWVNGFSALDLLRSRPALTAPEVLNLIEPLAAAADHAREKGLAAPDLSPGHVLLAFDAALDPPAKTALLAAPLATWPACHPKVLPLSLRSEFASAATWTGPAPIVSEGYVAPGPVRQLALLTQELLGGTPSAANNAAAGPPLAALSDEGNRVLRTALQPGDSAVFASATAFAAAMRASLAETPAHPAVVAPQSLPSLGPSGPSNARGGTSPGHVRPAMVAVLVAVAACIFLGLLAGLGFAAWKFLLPALKQPLASAQASLGNGSKAVRAGASPVIRRALPVVAGHGTPVPMKSAVAAGPAATPAEDRAARFKELLAKAQSLDHDGDAAGALSGYVALAQDYPDQDQGLSRVDSFISGLRATPLAPEAEANRAKQLRDPMERAAGLGSDLAMAYLGDHLVATEPATAAEWYREAADKGEPEAMFALGNMYFTGSGVARQPAEAARYFTLASNKGYVRAKIYLAERYEEGKGGVARNFDQAFSLLNEALGLDPNNAIVMEKLAIDYERGRGTPVDAPKAFALMKRAVELGNVNAMGNLGVYYMNGFGQPHKNPREAAALFKQGADKNSVVCMFSYAQCVFEGVEGTPPNRAVAVSYYRAAAERGFPPARVWCKDNNVSFAGAD